MSFARLQGAWIHHEMYAAKSEYGELTLARRRRLRNDFVKHYTCMSATQCWAPLKYC